MTEPTEEELEAARQFAVQSLRDGVRVPVVVEQLVEKGVGEIQAFQIVRVAIGTAHQVPTTSRRREGVTDIRNGLLLLVVVTVLGFLSYAFAVDRGGGRYFVGGGAFVVGFIIIIRGIWRLSRG